MVRLKGHDFIKVDFSNANFSNANFRHTDISNTTFRYSNFMNVDLSGSILLGTDLRHSKNLSIEQLFGEEPPLLCNVAFPAPAALG